MNPNDHADWLYERDAWFFRADRFAGFDRGDTDSYDEERAAYNDADPIMQEAAK